MVDTGVGVDTVVTRLYPRAGADLLVVMGVHRTPVRRKFLCIIALFDHVCTP
jgi:hypothetical protein